MAKAKLVGIYVELPEDLRDRFKAFCESGGHRIASEIRLALERHLEKQPGQRERAKISAAIQPVATRGRPKKTPIEK